MTRLIGEDVDALADVATIRFLHEQLGGGYPISGDLIARHKTFEATASTKKTGNELQLAPVATGNPTKGTVMSDVSTAVSNAPLPDPGEPTEEQCTDMELFAEWADADRAWRHQFIPAILAAAPDWAKTTLTDAERHTDEGTLRDTPNIRTILRGHDYLPQYGAGTIAQNADYDPETGTLTLDGDPYIDLYFDERHTLEQPWTINDLDRIAAAVQDLADAANRLGLPDGVYPTDTTGIDEVNA